MSSDGPILRAGRLLHRRQFLRRVGASAVGLTLGMMGQSQRVAANCGVSCGPGLATPFCCCTCFTPTSNCQSTCSGCSWCWSCFSTCDNQYYQCCECHYSNDGCATSSCSNVMCSWTLRLGSRPIAAKPTIQA